MSEFEHQSALIKWAKLQSKTMPALSLLFSIPNGTFCHIKTATKLKASGLTPGVPDLMLAYPTQTKSGLFIEMKEPKTGKVSALQKAMIERLSVAGYQVNVCYGWEDAKQTILEYLK